ncbi:hypothetical protein MTR67_023452 [Solanum verrucosum]|uniref:Uncharacterized protein n=1 Tax=Solanum verrucosum TaxID=315347 RepID=A0AAF0TRE2_SOLVR|nr:hypothetical protein MTR67_023452 [Solanum verrucosum]
MNNSIIEPWLIMGVFNSILLHEDRPVGSQVQDADVRDFRECLRDCNLAELQIGGREYTWKNGHVYSRIDKVIGNYAWMDKMPTQVTAMDPLLLDHSPLGLIIEEQKDEQKGPFRFYNYLGDHPKFKKGVQADWQITGGGMKGIWRNLKMVRREMQKLNKT